MRYINCKNDQNRMFFLMVAVIISGCATTERVYVVRKTTDKDGKIVEENLPYNVVIHPEDILESFKVTDNTTFKLEADAKDKMGKGEFSNVETFNIIQNDDLTRHTLALCKAAWLGYNTAPWDQNVQDKYYSILTLIATKSLDGRLALIEKIKMNEKEKAAKQETVTATAKTLDANPVLAPDIKAALQQAAVDATRLSPDQLSQIKKLNNFSFNSEIERIQDLTKETDLLKTAVAVRPASEGSL